MVHALGTAQPPSRLTPHAWLNDLHQALQKTECRVQGRAVSFQEGCTQFRAELLRARQENSAVWWMGNGGSQAICSHLSQDLLNKLKIRSQALSDPSLLTCMANDFGYEEVYSRPLQTLAQEGDLLICISSSGKSKNILKCVELARRKSAHVVTFSAFSPENPLWNEPTNVAFFLPAELYGIVEIGHSALIHGIIECLVYETYQP